MYTFRVKPIVETIPATIRMISYSSVVYAFTGQGWEELHVTGTQKEDIYERGSESCGLTTWMQFKHTTAIYKREGGRELRTNDLNAIPWVALLAGRHKSVRAVIAQVYSYCSAWNRAFYLVFLFIPHTLQPEFQDGICREYTCYTQHGQHR